MHRRIALSFFGFSALPSFACTISPAVVDYTKDQLIAKTKAIVLAECVASREKSNKTLFSFRTVQAIRGKRPRTFNLILRSAPKGYVEIDFASHTDPEFWNGTYGRLPWLPGLCEPTYAFEVGGQYLLFVDSLGNGAAAERIRTPDNKWYQYVRAKVKNAA